MTYNMTNLESAAHFPDMAVAVNNDISGGLLSISFLIVIGIVIMISFRDKDMRAVFVGSTFILTVIALGMFVADFTSWQVLVTLVIMFIVSLMFYFVTKDS